MAKGFSDKFNQFKSSRYFQAVNNALCHIDDQVWIQLVLPCYEKTSNKSFWNTMFSPTSIPNLRSAYLNEEVATNNIKNAYYVSQYVPVWLKLDDLDLESLVNHGLTAINNINPQNMRLDIATDTKQPTI